MGSVYFVTKYFAIAPPELGMEENLLLPGSRFRLEGIDWRARDRTLVLALSTKCPICSESASFYKRVINGIKQNEKVELVALFPQDTNEARKYLRELSLSIMTVKSVALSPIGVRGTPTLILVDQEGRISEVWEGRLSELKQFDVLKCLLLN